MYLIQNYFREVFSQTTLLNGQLTTDHRYWKVKLNIMDLMEQCQGMSREADMIETYVRGLEAGRQSALAIAGGRCLLKATLLMKREQSMDISGLIFPWEGEEVMVQLRLVIIAMGSSFPNV